MTGLAELLDQVARDVHLPAHGGVTMLSMPDGPVVAAVLGFTAHHVIASDADPEWLTSQLARSDMARPLKPEFLVALGEHLDATPGGDNLLVARGVGTQSGSELGVAEDPVALNHSRVERALRYRQDVSVVTVPGGLATIGRGLAGRWEISIEVEKSRRGLGIGRDLAERGRALVPDGAVLWAQVHPANVASMRVFLAAGYRPLGAEVLLTRGSAAGRR